MHVPLHIDGASAQVSSVGRSIGRGVIDTTQWNDMTRILSWKVGELYSGAVCEFEAIFPLLGSGRSGGGGSESYAEPILAQEEEEEEEEEKDIARKPTMFPVLLRYDCDGSLLSDIDLDFMGWKGGGGLNDAPPPIVKRKFRVYHREV